LGLDVPSLWEGLVAGRSGTRRITRFDVSDLPSQVAGDVQGFDPLPYMNKKEARRLPRGAQFAIAAAQQAVDDAGLDVDITGGERAGVIIGTGMGAYDHADFHVQEFRRGGFATVSPFAMPHSLPNMWSQHVSQRFGMLGPISTVSTACATGTMAIGRATDWIRSGRADTVLAGGVEALLHDYAIAGFAAMRALSTGFNDRPARASRPFDLERDGFVFSEGGGVVVLESLEHARARSADVCCEVLGYGLASDAFHIVAPNPSGDGYLRAMWFALEDARVDPTDIDLINAHASSTQLNDATETQAIKRLLGDDAYRVPVNATKSMLGHSLGGAGGLEVIACVLTIRHGVVHPTINYETPDPACDLDYVPNEARRMPVDFILDNSFAMGGNNACLVLGRV
jgi:beta-ketoacyl-acyl-carrier-protein synthase II